MENPGLIFGSVVSFEPPLIFFGFHLDAYIIHNFFVLFHHVFLESIASAMFLVYFMHNFSPFNFSVLCSLSLLYLLFLVSNQFVQLGAPVEKPRRHEVSQVTDKSRMM